MQLSSFSDQVDDTLILQFANLSIEERCQKEAVCTRWRNILVDDYFWKPVHKQIHPCTCNEPLSGVKEIVLKDLCAYQALAENIMALMEDNKVAQKICPPYTLEALKNMPPLVRTLHIAKSDLRKDCTRFFVYLPRKYLHTFNTEKKHAEKHRLLNEEQLEQLAQNLQATNKSFPLLSLLIEEQYGQFDPVTLLSKLCQFLCYSFITHPQSTPYIRKYFLDICACIIKKHPDLSGLHSIPSPIVGPPLSIAKYITNSILRRQDITMKDLQRCKIVPMKAKTAG